MGGRGQPWAPVGGRAMRFRASTSVSAVMEMPVHLPPSSRDLCTRRALFPGRLPTHHRPGIPGAASRSSGARGAFPLPPAEHRASPSGRPGGPHVTEPRSPPAPATRGWRALQHWASVGSLDAREPRASASPACRPVHTGWQPQLPKTRVLAHPTLAKRPSSAACHALMDGLTAGELHLPLPAWLPCPTSHLLLLGPLPGDPNDGQLQDSPPGLPHSPGHRGPAPRPPPMPCAQAGRRANSY